MNGRAVHVRLVHALSRGAERTNGESEDRRNYVATLLVTKAPAMDQVWQKAEALGERLVIHGPIVTSPGLCGPRLWQWGGATLRCHKTFDTRAHLEWVDCRTPHVRASGQTVWTVPQVMSLVV